MQKTETPRDLRNAIAQILVKNNLRTDQVAIGELAELFAKHSPASDTDLNVGVTPVSLNQQVAPAHAPRDAQDGGFQSEMRIEREGDKAFTTYLNEPSHDCQKRAEAEALALYLWQRAAFEGACLLQREDGKQPVKCFIESIAPALAQALAEQSAAGQNDYEVGKIVGMGRAAGLLCSYCADSRAVERPDAGGYWHRVARGGDLGQLEPCKAHAIHRAFDADVIKEKQP